MVTGCVCISRHLKLTPSIWEILPIHYNMMCRYFPHTNLTESDRVFDCISDFVGCVGCVSSLRDRQIDYLTSCCWLGFDERLISRSKPNQNGHTRYPIDSPKCGESNGVTCVAWFVTATMWVAYLGQHCNAIYRKLTPTISHLPFIPGTWLLEQQLTRGCWWCG